MPATEPPAIAADTKDWTWVIAQGCPECGFTPPVPTAVATRVRSTVPRWTRALGRDDAAVRSEPHRWSTLEYGCHVRDVCRVFGGRLGQLLTESDPTFADWDQDEAATAARYHAQDPSTVAAEYAQAAETTARLFDKVSGEQWERRGTRSNGSAFTVATLGVYFLHDLEHHLHDVDG